MCVCIAYELGVISGEKEIENVSGEKEIENGEMSCSPF